MSVTLFVWESKFSEGQVGHASASVGSPSTYISWWPEKEDTDPYSPSSPGLKMARISSDTREENRPPDFASAPISGLDESAIIKFWNGMNATTRDYGRGGKQAGPTELVPSGPRTTYNLYTNNCSTVVLKCLVAGGLYDVFPVTERLMSAALIITPEDIRMLANVVTDFAGGDIRAFSYQDHLVRKVAGGFSSRVSVRA